jgi:hypothetical protein
MRSSPLQTRPGGVVADVRAAGHHGGHDENQKSPVEPPTA